MSSFPPLQIPGDENPGHRSCKLSRFIIHRQNWEGFTEWSANWNKSRNAAQYSSKESAWVGFSSTCKRSRYVWIIVKSIYCVRKIVRIQCPRGAGSDCIHVLVSVYFCSKDEHSSLFSSLFPPHLLTSKCLAVPVVSPASPSPPPPSNAAASVSDPY